ncbi:T9SS type A sorting domain-containing protein [Puia dinghuensis]|uniref:Secretion system C-terminal sorting domain-containing protein n=1 Tax=Puia dinghuensis TaxID=1792502 RepID=A0A8J2XQV4_9BACT|nr:T9SS type A sorting domain-containing protein [Puia dinghuensis]GGA86619.1 hypothetical protein GCM10011511_07120 [Puia dinghuensis]
MKNDARVVVYLLLIVFHYCNAHGQTVSGTVNSYYQVTAVNTATNTVTVSNAAGLTAGQRVFLYQAKGAVITSTNTSGYGDITTLNNAGGYELNTICSISGNQVWLVNTMVHTYDPTGQVQLVTVPSSPSLTVSGTVTGASWNPATGTGGIVALEATGTINLNAGINVSGQGFQGGALVNYAIPPYNCDWTVTVSDYYFGLTASGYYNGGKKGEGIAAYIVNEEYGRGKLANGGGGGDNGNSGGAGGGNYGVGGAGGQRTGESFFDCHAQYPGIGGAALSALGYSTAANRIFFGGGGGSGQENNGVGEPGANGGGIIFLSAPTIVGGGGQLLAYGLRPTNPTNTDPLQAEGDGGGGGGAGGTIVLNAATITGSITAQAYGGRGSDASNLVNDCTGPGGGGGGGIIWAAGGVFPAAVSATVTGGANGVVSSGNSKLSCQGASNGATSGAAGLSQSGYTLPVSAGPVCTILASPALQYLNASRGDQDVILTWGLSSSAAATDIRSFIIQRSTDLAHFDSLATLPCSQAVIDYQYTDAAVNIDGAVAYRLAWKDDAGDWSYSRIVAVPGMPGPDAASIRLYPNPATDHLTMTVISNSGGDAAITVSNALGQSLLIKPVTLHRGLNTISVALNTLAPATYFLVLESAGRRLVKPFLKRNE